MNFLFRRQRSSRIDRPSPHTFRPGLEALEARDVPSITLNTISNVSVPGGKTLFVPVTATSSAPITYTVSSNNSQVTATLHNGDPFVQFTLSDPGVPSIDGQTVLVQLFPENAPNNVSRLLSAINSGFYNGLTFYRTVQGFVIQGGNKTGTGQDFPDEYTSSSIFTAPGTLAYANSGDNTNDSEFFITTSPSIPSNSMSAANPTLVAQQRALDFNFTVLGQVVRGLDVVNAIANQEVGTTQSPGTTITITSAQVISDTADNVLTVFAPLGQSATITVTADNGVDAPVMQTFTATAVADTYNDPPFLVRPLANQTTTAGTPVTFTLPAIDLEGDPMTFEAILQGTSASNAKVSVNGNQVTVTPNAGFTGTLSLLVGVEQTGATTRGNDSELFDTALMTVTVNPTPPTPPTPPTLFTAVGADAGGSPQVIVYNPSTGAVVASFYAFSPKFTGGVRVAVADINGDGTDDIIAAAGPGGGPQVEVIDGTKLSQLLSNGQINSTAFLTSFYAFANTFTGGVYVAAGVTAGGQSTVVLSAGPGGGPQVEAFSGQALVAAFPSGNVPLPLFSFNALSPSFTGGVNVALLDVNGDGVPDIIAGAGPGGGPQVEIFDGLKLLQTARAGQNMNGALLTSFEAMTPSFTGGVFVAAGFDASGQARIIVGAGAGGGPQVSVFLAKSLLAGTSLTPTPLSSFYALPSNFTGGVRVGFSDEFGSAGTPAILTSAGAGGGPQVSAFDSSTLQVLSSFFALPGGYSGGLFVAG